MDLSQTMEFCRCFIFMKFLFEYKTLYELFVKNIEDIIIATKTKVKFCSSVFFYFFWLKPNGLKHLFVDYFSI